MSDESERPLIGPLQRKWLAAVFGSENGKISGIANQFDQARCRAVLRFKEREATQAARDLYFFKFESADGSLKRVPAAKRAAALAAYNQAAAKIEDACRDDLRRPMLLREKREGLLNPWKDDDNDD